MFIALAGALALITAIVLALPFLRAGSEGASRADYDVETYKAQLQEIDQDVARSVLTETEAAAARTEVSRRLLGAADKAQVETAAATTPRNLRKPLTALVALGAPAMAIAIYLSIGAAGRPDMPLASRTDAAAVMAQRPSQSQAEALLAENGLTPAPVPLTTPDAQRMDDLIRQIEERILEEPDDVTGRLLLARSTAQMQRYQQSWRHFASVIVIDPDQPADVFADMSEAMILAANGYLSPDAERAVELGLQRDAQDQRLRHFKAVALAQRGETAKALAGWTSLLSEADASTPWAPMIYARAAQAAEELGVDPPPRPQAAPGPDADAIAAASEMSEEDRAAMIEGMVSGLATRLADDPDDLQGWLRLIRAYTVMGREEDREAALETARATFAGDEAALARLEEAAL